MSQPSHREARTPGAIDTAFAIAAAKHPHVITLLDAAPLRGGSGGSVGASRRVPRVMPGAFSAMRACTPHGDHATWTPGGHTWTPGIGRVGPLAPIAPRPPWSLGNVRRHPRAHWQAAVVAVAVRAMSRIAEWLRIQTSCLKERAPAPKKNPNLACAQPAQTGKLTIRLVCACRLFIDCYAVHVVCTYAERISPSPGRWAGCCRTAPR